MKFYYFSSSFGTSTMLETFFKISNIALDQLDLICIAVDCAPIVVWFLHVPDLLTYNNNNNEVFIIVLKHLKFKADWNHKTVVWPTGNTFGIWTERSPPCPLRELSCRVQR